MTDLDKLTKQLKSGTLSRRDFLKATSMFGLAASAPAVLFSTSAHAAPSKGGHLRFGMGHGSTTDSLDPATWDHAFTQTMGKSIHNFLTDVKPDGNLGPELAESWEASSDAKTWTLKIRKGVEFHNGQPLKSSDVVASLNHHAGEDSKSGAKVIVETFAGIKADGDHTVVITLKEGNADLPYQLSDYHLAIMPAKDGKVDATSGVGCGSYTLKSYEPGVRAELTKFDKHWNSEEGFADSIEMLTIADVAARTNALTTGEVDVIDRLDVKTLHLLARNKKVNIMETSGNAHYSMPMRADTDPYKNNDVRLALKYSLDREALLKNVLRGHGYIGNDHPIGKANRYFDTKLEQRSYDPDKAKFHLKKSGVGKLKIELSAADAAFAGAVDAAVLYKEHAAKAGIDVKVVREPNDGYWSNVWMKKPFCMCYWGGRATEDWMFSTAYSDGAKWNDAFWKHDQFNELLIQARAELDEGKRAEIYSDMQRIVKDEGSTAIPIFNNYIFAASNDVGVPEVLGNDWSLDGLRAPTRWWKKS